MLLSLHQHARKPRNEDSKERFSTSDKAEIFGNDSKKSKFDLGRN
jgi:hypothetical protein